MNQDHKPVVKLPFWTMLALAALSWGSIALLMGWIDLSGTVPGWVGLLALAAFASLLVIL